MAARVCQFPVARRSLCVSSALKATNCRRFRAGGGRIIVEGCGIRVYEAHKEVCNRGTPIEHYELLAAKRPSHQRGKGLDDDCLRNWEKEIRQ